uniref:Solute-binding protein family 5 domain-containing protein n=1 Tax=Acyrthosiphon pisum TaxID=7029 RepID=A0A8R2HA03_ACYPI|eukprot:XP_016664369.1 PREDICTED: oligopeptide-binding protein OppA-like [Acyrthosiphon pisum]
MKKYKVIFMIVVSLMLILSACSNDKDEKGSNIKQSKSKNELNLSSGDDIPTMDPSLAADQVLQKINLKNTSDGKTWTIQLRDNAKWSNGDPVTAHDFVYAWQRSVDPDTAAEFAYMFENIENAKEITQGDKKPEELGVKAIDDHTLQIKLIKDVPWMESLLAFGSYMPQNEKFVEKQGDKFGTTAKTTLSNGPYKLTEWKPEDKWKLEKNDEYWDKDKVKVKDVNVKVVKNTQTAINMYQTGKLDMVGLDAQNIKKYKDREDFSTEATSDNAKKDAEYFKEQIEQNLPGVTIKVKQQLISKN